MVFLLVRKPWPGFIDPSQFRNELKLSGLVEINTSRAVITILKFLPVDFTSVCRRVNRFEVFIVGNG